MQAPLETELTGLTGRSRSTIKSAIAALVLSALAVSFAISFASIVYSGPLTPHLIKGIGIALLGNVFMPVVAAFMSSYRGIVVHAQDVPAVLLAIAAASVASTMALAPGETVFATVAAVIGLTSVFTGLVMYVAGRLNLGFIARFIPYSVIGGFLAATGYLLLTGALGMMIKQEVSVTTVANLFEPGNPVRWIPWLILAAVFVAATRRFESDFVLPGLMLAAGAIFYLFLAAFGIDIATAGEMGLLLGPFAGSNFLEGVTPALVNRADWLMVLSQAPTIIAVAAMSVLGLLLNASGIEVVTGRDLDLERELRASGVANIVAGGSGGFVGYHLLGETTLATKLGLRSAVPGISISIASIFILLFGADLVALLPVGLMASVVAFLGLDFLYEWLWCKRRRLPLADMAIILLILVVAAAIGFLQALSVGLLTATILFVFSYSGIDMVRLQSTAAVRRSSVERSAKELDSLSRAGGSVAIYELTGYLFFGTAARLLERIQSDIASGSGIRGIIVDFARVSGVDTSAAFAVSRIADYCRREGITLMLTGLDARSDQRLSRAVELGDTRRLPDLDAALIELETEILQDRDGHAQDEPPDLSRDLSKRYPKVDFATFVTTRDLEAGEQLLAQGSESTAMYQLISGELRAEVAGPDGSPKVVSRFRPGALVGEVALYASVPRTASVIAETPARVVRFDLENLPDTPEARALAGELHREAAGYLAQRLIRMTKLFREAGF